jgi:hypothetical protein
MYFIHQEQLTAKDNSLSTVNSEIDRLNQEISRLDRLQNEKTEDAQRLTNDLENCKKELEVSRVSIVLFTFYFFKFYSFISASSFDFIIYIDLHQCQNNFSASYAQKIFNRLILSTTRVTVLNMNFTAACIKN